MPTLNREFDNIVYLWNQMDAGTSAWQISAGIHFAGSSGAPSVAKGTGAGAAATVSVTGSDVAGLIVVNTDAADTPSANADIVTLTFNTAYATVPYVIVVSSNDATANLSYGVWRIRQSDVTTSIFKIRSGATPLPATTAAAYNFNYMVVQ